MAGAASAVMEDPFGFILEEAGTISSSQQDILRRSSFIRNPRVSSSSDEDEEGARYRISIRPITMRSASDSYSSSLSSSGGGEGGCGGERHHRRAAALEAEGPVEKRPGPGGVGEGRWVPSDGGDRPLGMSGEKETCLSKAKRRQPLEEGVTAVNDGTSVAARTVKKPCVALSDESTQEPDEIFSAEGHPGGCGGQDIPDSPVPSPSGKVVAKRLGFSGRGGETSEQARYDNPQAGLSGDPTADDEFAHSKNVRPGPSAAGNPNECGKNAVALRRLPRSFQNASGGERDDGSGTVPMSGRTPLVQGPKRPEAQPAPPPPRGSEPEEGPKEIRPPSDLVDLLITFSKKPTEMLESVDFLEVLATKGIDIPPPRWWRPGGYPLKKEGEGETPAKE